MINVYDILETIRMIQDACLDIRTITMGISLMDCIDSDIDRACEKVYDKITRCAANLVKAGEEAEDRSLWQQALDCYRMVYDLTQDEEIAQKIRRLS